MGVGMMVGSIITRGEYLIEAKKNKGQVLAQLSRRSVAETQTGRMA
jgi:hypothetical protein